MCGIIGYIGNKQALPVLIKGLRRLEYRGYDSAGVAVLDKEKIHRTRAVGKIDELAEKVKQEEILGTIGIAHTRWATHGGVTEDNAHPHFGKDGKLVLVHNGIIENYREIKEKLGDKHEYKSETDTEILAHLIESHYKGNLREAVEHALSHVRGTYGLVVMHADHPDSLITARLGSPLVVGVGEGEYYIASDATPMLTYTKKVIYLEDGEVAEISKDKMETFNLKDEVITKCVEEIEWDDEQAEKQGYDHFMLKEIFDQPTVFEDAIRGRYNLEEGAAHLGGLNMTVEEMRSVDRIILIACGTASYAAMVGKYAFERLAGIPTEVDVASEFRYRDPIVNEKTLVFGISQSGETADTIAALREAKRKGAYVRGIVNVVGSTIARETDGGSYIHAGPELAVASTKAYTNMIAIMMLYALQFGRLRRITPATGQRLLKALREIPAKMNQILEQADKIKAIAEKYKDYKDVFFLGRGINFPVALEGSLKLKEISYIHSEAYPGGEMKHGPIALLSEDFPVIGIMTKDQLYDKMRSNIEEIRARKAPLLLIATQGDEGAKELSDDVIYVPDTMELLEPLLNTIPLQIFAYHVAVMLGRDVDRPRNLAKSVTVE
ncbi:glutamine--fructose-6-phosphate transaminase (isomerizing) [Candidatus Parcubacteria bacterium]|jgi:glutamine---fructose-6-phosphate transaminase (isomerizing)|nr:glutamine--fructose-6-phosphate transaminase (isomerizing) [Candidatus Parcubacteria bacterium]MBT3949340.1 glutamine--fructose-6-phosphate transaminase (isomerizing) [Candidatus Parcubacteria bacterium]